MIRIRLIVHAMMWDEYFVTIKVFHKIKEHTLFYNSQSPLHIESWVVICSLPFTEGREHNLPKILGWRQLSI